MRVIHATPRKQARNQQPPNDALVEGTAYFEAVFYEPGEAVPAGEQPRRISEWLAMLGPGQPLRVPAGSRLIGVPEAVIPRPVLDALPADGLLDLRWHWSRKRS